MEGLVACGKNYHNSPTLRKACEFLLSKQLADGGWGESYLSSSNKVSTNSVVFNKEDHFVCMRKMVYVRIQ